MIYLYFNERLRLSKYIKNLPKYDVYEKPYFAYFRYDIHKAVAKVGPHCINSYIKRGKIFLPEFYLIKLPIFIRIPPDIIKSDLRRRIAKYNPMLYHLGIQHRYILEILNYIRNLLQNNYNFLLKRYFKVLYELKDDIIAGLLYYIIKTNFLLNEDNKLLRKVRKLKREYNSENAFFKYMLLEEKMPINFLLGALVFYICLNNFKELQEFLIKGEIRRWTIYDQMPENFLLQINKCNKRHFFTIYDNNYINIKLYFKGEIPFIFSKTYQSKRYNKNFGRGNYKYYIIKNPFFATVEESIQPIKNPIFKSIKRFEQRFRKPIFTRFN